MTDRTALVAVMLTRLSSVLFFCICRRRACLRRRYGPRPGPGRDCLSLRYAYVTVSTVPHAVFVLFNAAFRPILISSRCCFLCDFAMPLPRPPAMSHDTLSLLRIRHTITPLPLPQTAMNGVGNEEDELRHIRDITEQLMGNNGLSERLGTPVLSWAQAKTDGRGGLAWPALILTRHFHLFSLLFLSFLFSFLLFSPPSPSLPVSPPMLPFSSLPFSALVFLSLPLFYCLYLLSFFHCGLLPSII